MEKFSIPYFDLFDRYCPRFGSRRRQHVPHRCTDLAELIPGIVDRRTAAGQLRSEIGVDVYVLISRRSDNSNLLPVRIEFFGDNSRQSGIHTLPHLRVLGVNGDDVVVTDLDERVGRPLYGHVGRVR